MRKLSTDRGLVKAVLLIVVALVILGYFGYNLRDIIASPAVRDNLAYVWDIVVRAWNWLKDLLPSK
ncbi:MAG: hypothetical protein A3C08_02690 [Candidatus Taylorbacteria bacterium RIFCSPHIGHO2_02_FULL_47_18]|uniref:Uncharacterized protein n=1 Tax=Candidatus Taylorbacteria bacterium RIFCSPLOWO2_01_FULL_48_100 TaxID=1802322 RepID=A0A1G2NFS5_9BACT|nr:MAG: hypothetical protein A2670_02400 [Candidatus Taylorbacteria bacterium RIFCSPHIGHO2_01_FULL_48_38]OHA27607.1 MAG: hypothetical protein A3C08_02690 [Candidatus Taylorbacteria bacterium RIFCSPHIGHO2_02_FULL_47_18]OHA34299.1 MAG: hypothetical protein A2938_02075 [Candidatus Taylorbacteria bacterium RIFCSPLOWO2_01_FULL_48_100]OHA40453.1 MAG: hypothetical protein A3J31_02710 [Candidatus Taylorbacteria bacterium RIFCSPLOWO2_02_FULL_48_16]OHA44907.1 MAG: hypothetical protein A3H13_03315 [Candid